MTRREFPSTRFLRLRLIALGVGLGLLLRVVWGEYRTAGDDRQFHLPTGQIPASAPPSVE